MEGGVIKKEILSVNLRSWAGALFPVLAFVAALLVGGVMLLILGANPIAGFGALIDGAFGSLRALSDTAAKAVPLLLVAVGITIAFRSNVINIGGEGQIILGALFGTAFALLMPNLPTWLLLPGVLLAGFVGGALWGAIPGALKAYFNVNEILSTIMLNIVAVQAMNFLQIGRASCRERV